MKKQIEEIKDCIDSVYGCDCAYYGVEGMAIAQALYNEGYRKQSEKYLIKENGDVLPITHHSEWISVEDRLPKPHLLVLVYIRNVNTRVSVREGFIDACGEWFVGGIGRLPVEVASWMPMPDAPKGGAE